MTLKPGLHFDIPESVYHADPCERPSLSVSVAKVLLDRSPFHAAAIHPRLGRQSLEEGDDESTSVMQRGRLIHALLLGGGGKFATVMKTDKKTGVVSPADDYRTDSAKEFRDAAIARGEIPVLFDKLAEATRAADVLRSKLDIPQETEVTAVWESDGVLCRGRLDGFVGAFNGWIGWDLKTCDNAAAAATETNILKYGYHIQRAAYVEAIERLHPQLAGRGEWEFAFAEVTGVYDVIRCDLPGEMIELGRRQWARAKRIWAACLASDVWPGYDHGKRIIEAGARTVALLANEVGA
jgi:hypothetical protein